MSERCVLDEEIICPVLTTYPNLSLEIVSNFCYACATLRSLKKLEKQLAITLDQIKYSKMSMVFNLLSAFPKDEEKAKETYLKLLKFVKEWEKETT